LDTALASFVQQRVGAFLITAAPFFDTRMSRIVGFAAQNRLPAILTAGRLDIQKGSLRETHFLLREIPLVTSPPVIALI